MQLRDYQQRAVAGVRALWADGTRRVCLVAPTGSGKTVMGQALLEGYEAPLWVCHRRELVKQTQARLGAAARVVTVQKLLASGQRPECDLFVLDEAHHYVADEWHEVAKHYAEQPVVGLTATPERSDGKPLGDMFDELMVAAQYSELIEAGHLVDCQVFRAPELLESGCLAQHPIDAYRKHAPGQQGFFYVSRVDHAYEQAQVFNAAGIETAVIEAKTPKLERDAIIADFADGGRRLLANVYTLTEGVDVPAATVCLLARRCSHASIFLQMVGRVLRPAEGKDRAILVDLTGVSHLHGMPTDDRVYSLTGSAMRSAGSPIKDCPECQAVVTRLTAVCPTCGYVWPDSECVEPQEAPKPVIYSMALEEVFAGSGTPRKAKNAEWERLVDLCFARDWGLAWAMKEYQKLFPDERPTQIRIEDKAREYRRLIRFAAMKGYKRGWASHRYKSTFGVWPSRMGFDANAYYAQMSAASKPGVPF
jgi:superfamily II DNA or RNA helicase